MKKILFRADAAPHIGIGDLMSLINLSHYLESTWECHFLIRKYPAGMELTEKYGVANCHLLEADASVEEEVAALNALIKEHGIELLFFEITERRLTDYTGLDPSVKKAAVCFDGHIPQGMDLVIDWDVEAQRYFTPEAHPHTRFLLGPEFVILPKAFYDEKITRRQHTLPPKRVLIAMGGADEFDFTAKVLKSIIASGADYEVTVVIGSGYANRDALEELLESSGIVYKIRHNITDMLDAYLQCDVAIGAGGLTSSELVASRTPSALIATYEHQVARCKYFDAMGLSSYLGYRSFDETALMEALHHPRIPHTGHFFKTHAIKEAIDALT